MLYRLGLGVHYSIFFVAGMLSWFVAMLGFCIFPPALGLTGGVFLDGRPLLKLPLRMITQNFPTFGTRVAISLRSAMDF